jgi:hypothetical protein
VTLAMRIRGRTTRRVPPAETEAPLAELSSVLQRAVGDFEADRDQDRKRERTDGVVETPVRSMQQTHDFCVTKGGRQM